MRTTRSSTGTLRATTMAASALVLLAGVGLERPAFAGSDEREQCASSAEQAQQLRDEGKYRRARELMLFCARPSCPGAIKADCSKWLGELDRDAPTVVFGARDSGGADVMDVRVSMDGTPIQERLDGKPVPVDAGEHTFKFETKAGAMKEERVLIRTGEKSRSLIATFPGPDSKKAPPPPTAAPTPPTKEGGSEPSLVPAIVVGAGGVVALGAFAYFGLTGKSDYDDLQKCKPNCAQKDVDSTRTKLLVADISLGVGIVALGVATYLFVTRPAVDSPVQVHSGTSKRPLQAVRFDASPVAGGGLAGVTGSF